jgi:Cu(I)/Ag(I) efflux system membrane protein CusA/SilA
MISRVIDLSAKHQFVVFTLIVLAAAAGYWSMQRIPLDAIPDLSDTQVIVYSRWDRSPDVIEDQVTYPIVSAMLGAPGVKAVRGFSDFGYSYVYAIFKDGTDIYWARSRTLEYLSSVLPRLPEGVKSEIGPDATGLGWVFQYVLVDRSGKHNLADLRSYQDWNLRYYLKSVPGVAEVASVGGFGRQYQVNVDPNRLRAYGIPITRVTDAVRNGNVETSGRLLEFGGTEYMVRGHGYIQSVHDIENIVLVANERDAPIRIKDVGQVTLGPDLRRGIADLDGEGEAVSGIVVMRHAENALNVIEAVKAKIRQIERGLPDGVKIIPIYDRSELIRRSIANLKSTLVEEIVSVAFVILLFLWHVPSAVIPVITIPLAILISFVPLGAMGITANIMSLGGIAIAIGALVDASIVVVEQTHKKLEEWQRNGRRADYRVLIIEAVKEVGSPSFFALLVIAVAFLPVLTLEAQEGRLFRPLAYTKSLTMVVAAALAITLDPALRLLFTRARRVNFRPRWLCKAANAVLVGTFHSEERHPISRILMRIYEPVLSWSLRWKWVVLGGAVFLVAITIPVYWTFGSEFMPSLDEGSLLYMPSAMPGISIGEAQKLLQVTDRLLKEFPEVDHVLGKAGRADTATDPAPLSMFETVIVLKPNDQWRKIPTWYSAWSPDFLKPIFRHITPDHFSREELVQRMNTALDLPGLANAWTMPVRGRTDMLTTGLRTPIGLKITGSNLQTIDEIGAHIESALRAVPGTRSVFAERSAGGSFIDVQWNREQLARYGLSIQQAQAAVQFAIGGEDITTTIEGRERYPVNVRYLRDFRSDFRGLSSVLVPASDGQRQIPLGELATISTANGPTMIRDEDGLLTGYVYVDIAGPDPSHYVADATRTVENVVKLPPGYAIFWGGQYQAMERVSQRLRTVVPLTLAAIFLLLYLNTRSIAKTLIVLLAVPFSAIGAIWLLYFLGYPMSVAVWVGLIALLGVDAETGVFMLLYLDLAYERAKREGALGTLSDLHKVIRQGAAGRLRPKCMTVAAMIAGLVPIMWATGTGSDVMKRIAAPMIGGMCTSFVLELLVYPVIYELWRGGGLRPFVRRTISDDVGIELRSEVSLLITSMPRISKN